MPGKPYDDADVAAGARAITAALGHRPWRQMTPRTAARAVLDALTAPGSPLVARIRAQAGQDVARALLDHPPEDWALAGSYAGEDAARIAREVTGTEGDSDG